MPVPRSQGFHERRQSDRVIQCFPLRRVSMSKVLDDWCAAT